MRCVFFTKPKEVTVNILKYLIEKEEEILAVVLYQKDTYSDSEFIKICVSNGIPVIDFTEADLFFENLDSVDVIFCSTFPKLIKQKWILKAKKAALNFHTAPLPDYRGVFAFNFAIYNEEKKFGVTCHCLSDRFDEGDIVDISWFDYDCSRGNVESLVKLSNEKLFEQFKKVHNLLSTSCELPRIKQNTGKYYKREYFECLKRVTPELNHKEINKRIRAFWYPPYEGAYIEIDGVHYELLPKQERLSDDE